MPLAMLADEQDPDRRMLAMLSLQLQ